MFDGEVYKFSQNTKVVNKFSFGVQFFLFLISIGLCLKYPLAWRFILGGYLLQIFAYSLPQYLIPVFFKNSDLHLVEISSHGLFALGRFIEWDEVTSLSKTRIEDIHIFVFNNNTGLLNKKIFVSISQANLSYFKWAIEEIVKDTYKAKGKLLSHLPEISSKKPKKDLKFTQNYDPISKEDYRQGKALLWATVYIIFAYYWGNRISKDPELLKEIPIISNVVYFQNSGENLKGSKRFGYVWKEGAYLHNEINFKSKSQYISFLKPQIIGSIHYKSGLKIKIKDNSLFYLQSQSGIQVGEDIYSGLVTIYFYNNKINYLENNELINVRGKEVAPNNQIFFNNNKPDYFYNDKKVKVKF